MIIVKPKESPEALLKEIKATVKTPTVETWSIDSDGDFTHLPSQWKHKGWFRPRIDGNDLVFRFLGNKNEVTSKEVYGVYHGRFIEMLLNHFDDKFKTAEATALPAKGDLITES